MLWLEMSRDTAHGGEGWDFGECLWSPAYKNTSTQSRPVWPFWESLLEVREGDPVLHLRGKGDEASFLGISTAASDGFETTVRPSIAGQWEYADKFYKVLLKNFAFFDEPISLSAVFTTKRDRLLQYVKSNREKHKGDRKRLFYTLQAGRLQCLNGAYLSEVDSELSDILLDTGLAVAATPSKAPTFVNVGECSREVAVRIGQRDFSSAVRSAYEHQCCFPGCQITHSGFLVASHIARWADAPQLRGLTANGLCLCLFHDKAFELGLFVLTDDLTVFIDPARLGTDASLWESLKVGEGKRLRLGSIVPSIEAIRLHRQRVGNG